MGVQGLKRLVEDRYGRAVGHIRVGRESGQFEHVLIDLNSVLHSCISHGRSTRDTIVVVLEELGKILSAAVPTKSLTIAIDGPAPQAKIPMQRSRRRQAALQLKETTQITRLNLTPGTVFMKFLSDALVVWAAQLTEELPGVEIFISSDSVPGEGESKLFARLLELTKNDHYLYSTDSICLVGNDSDLVLGSMLSLYAINITILDSQTGTTVSVADIIGLWLQPLNVEPSHGKSFIAESKMHCLNTCRMSFALLSLLAGNDYVPGLEGLDSFSAWCAYTTSSLTTLVTKDGNINTRSLGEILKRAKSTPPTGREDTSTVDVYLKSLSWALLGLTGYGCLDYKWVYPHRDAPSVGQVITYCTAQSTKHITKGPSYVKGSAYAITPVRYLACVLPLKGWWLLPPTYKEKANIKRQRDESSEKSLAVSTLDGGDVSLDEIVDSVQIVLSTSTHSREQFSQPVLIKIGSPPKTTPFAKQLVGIKPNRHALEKASVTPATLLVSKTTLRVSVSLPQQHCTPDGDQMSITNPYTLFEWVLPRVKSGGGSKNKKEKTGIIMSSTLSMDMEV